MKLEIIAEIGQNHNGDLGLAKEMIHAAKEAGADVAKFQLFNAYRLFTPYEWYEYNCSTELTLGKMVLLFEECEKAGIEFMASVFDAERLSWLEKLNIKRHKIASRSIKDQALLEALAKTGKPLIVSLGMWDKEEFPVIETESPVDFLYCISEYPTPPEKVHLDQIDFNKYSGFSDHTIGIDASIEALRRGAQIIEKHFTLDKNMYGPDQAGSANPEELKKICDFRDELASLKK